jgi:hypothetical protein
VSTSLRGYCIKLSDLQSIVKKPPAGLLDKLLKRFPEHFKPRGRESAAAKSKALLKWLESDIEGRLLEMICAVRGVPIESVFFVDARILSIYKALDAGMGGGVCERLKEPRLPVEFPPPPKNWGPPWISYLTLEEIEEGLARPDKKTRKLDNWVADARDDLRVWLETAQEHGTDLVVFGT